MSAIKQFSVSATTTKIATDVFIVSVEALIRTEHENLRFIQVGTRLFDNQKHADTVCGYQVDKYTEQINNAYLTVRAFEIDGDWKEVATDIELQEEPVAAPEFPKDLTYSVIGREIERLMFGFTGEIFTSRYSQDDSDTLIIECENGIWAVWFTDKHDGGAMTFGDISWDKIDTQDTRY